MLFYTTEKIYNTLVINKPLTFPEFYTGAPVDASDLRYRDTFIDDLWEIIRTGMSC